MTAKEPFRGRLGIARAGYSAILKSSLVAVVVAVAIAWLSPWLAVLPFALVVFVIFFFRDPERTRTENPMSLLSPADGVVDDIGEVTQCEGIDAGEQRYLRIGIYLSLFSVHVQRAPAAANVLASFAVAGARIPTRRVGATDGNQRHVTVLAPVAVPSARCMIRQIAGPIARGIVNVARPGGSVAAGQRIGLIRFGSRVELFVSSAIVDALAVKLGTQVRAGITPLVSLRIANTPPAADVLPHDSSDPSENP
ncbi:MAG: phosphatidylserine decarboxylase [Planctomycetota bacterium]